MARRRLEGLERVLGANALCSTADGKVGSPIYYALGLVASFALGLTLIGVITTGLLLLHSRHLRRGDDDVPGGGRLLELSRGRLQRVLVVRGRVGERLSPTSAATTANSALFVVRPLRKIGGLFWDPLRSRRATSSPAGA